MPDYKKMYCELFSAVSNAIEILEKAQNNTLDLYIKSCENDDKNLENNKKEQKF